MLFEIGLFKKQNKTKQKKVWAIPIPISTTKDVICCSNGFIYHFLDYVNKNNNNTLYLKMVTRNSYRNY